MRIAVIALKNAAAANINTSSVTRLSHSNLSRSVMLISLESLPQFVNDFFARICSSEEQSPPKACATQFKETLVLKSSRSRAILGALDILVDIGVPAEKEVIL
jgi:hypothetical protein